MDASGAAGTTDAPAHLASALLAPDPRLETKTKKRVERGLEKAFRVGSLPVPGAPVAFVVTNQYENLYWPKGSENDEDETMESCGTLQDIKNIAKCLESNLDFEISWKHNATKDDIIQGLLALSTLIFCLIYIQGHGSPELYYPSDCQINKRLEGITSDTMYNTLFDSGVNRRYVLVSDFCNAGGYYGLRYYLCLKGKPKWVESKYWNKKTPNCHAIHFAGAGRSQNAHEGDVTGGYFTLYIYLDIFENTKSQARMVDGTNPALDRTMDSDAGAAATQYQ
ncbi:ICE-like protease (caspase) p20 domain protein [Ceratobasidium sp. AG-Ba]|nr:ICE-like protease (caspase) p20 domain protein [Ceratobasidium sp. AG-Ba]